MRSYKNRNKRTNKNRNKRTKKHFYYMKGCSNKNCLGGGSGSGNIDLSKVYPSLGGTGKFPGWLNQQLIRGGGQKGGCNCLQQHGGQKGGNNGLPYGQNLPFMKNPVVPNGLTGQSWGADFKWPGVNGISGDFNHYTLNKYVPDVVTAIKNVGANIPFLNGGSKKKSRKGKRSYKKGGGFSNTLTQDLVTGGQNMMYNNDKFMAGIQGKSPPQSPLPYVQNNLLGTKY